MQHKLDEETAKHCGGQLLDAIERIGERHGWSAGDLLAVATVAMTGLVARRVGKFGTVEFFRDHADELERGIMTGKP